MLWVVAIPAAAALAVWGLREAGGDDAAGPVLSAGEALAIAEADPTPGAGPSPSPTSPAPTTAESPGDPATPTALRVPGAVLGLRCTTGNPVLVWSVPDPGWRMDETEREGTSLRVRTESASQEVRVTVACRSGTPVVTEVERSGDEGEDY